MEDLPAENVHFDMLGKFFCILESVVLSSAVRDEPGHFFRLVFCEVHWPFLRLNKKT